MKDEDLEVFAVADGLLAKMADQPPAGQVTDTERQWMLDQARDNLAKLCASPRTKPARRWTPPPWPVDSASSTAPTSPSSPWTAASCT
jgi:hypothetical protein